MDRATLDPDVVIEASGGEGDSHWLLYRRVSTGQQWYVGGQCNQCGLCVVGAANESDYDWRDLPGNPGAVSDVRFPTRPDEPVTPGFNEAMRKMAEETPSASVDGCSLSVSEYL